MAEKIKISIALATYHGSRYIAEQLQSLLQQTRVPDEIIICDDSSDDSTYEAVKPFLSDQRIGYHKNTSPLGVAGNFEKALSLTHGEIIFLCDQDDVWLPEKVDTLYQTLQNDPEADAVFCNSTLVNETLQPLGKTLWDLRNFTGNMQKQLNSGHALEVFLKRVTCSSHNIAFKRRCLEYILPFPELKPFFPDTFIALSIAANGKWHAVDQALTLYRIHSSNESSPSGSGLSAARRSRADRAALRSALIAGEIIRRRGDKLPCNIVCQLKKYAIFQKQRDSYSCNLLLRTLQVLREACKLNYCRYSSNFRTFFADILLK